MATEGGESFEGEVQKWSNNTQIFIWHHTQRQMELQMPKQSILQTEVPLLLPDVRLRKLDKEPSRVHVDKPHKHKPKLSKTQPKDQLKILQKYRTKQLKSRHTRQEQENQNLPSNMSAKHDDLNARINKERSRNRLETKARLQQWPLDRVLQQSTDQQTLVQQPVFEAQILEQPQLDGKEQVILLQEPGLKLPEIVQVTNQQGILPQEVVLVSYNGEPAPSETGIIAYDESGQVLLIRESDIKSVESYKNQHLIHTFDGTTYIIDNNTETTTVEPTYIVWDKSLPTSSPYLVDGVALANVVVPDEEATIFTEDVSANNTYGFQDWDDLDIYQAMTAFRIAETSETNSVLAQPPIMSTVENPSRVRLTPTDFKLTRKPTDPVCASQSIEDSLAKIGVITTESSNIPATLQLPSTVTDPTITSTIQNVTSEEEDESNTIIYTNNEYWQWSAPVVWFVAKLLVSFRQCNHLF